MELIVKIFSLCSAHIDVKMLYIFTKEGCIGGKNILIIQMNYKKEDTNYVERKCKEIPRCHEG